MPNAAQTDAEVYGTVEYDGDGTESVRILSDGSKPDHGPRGDLIDTVYTERIETVDDIREIAEQWALITVARGGDSISNIGSLVPRDEVSFNSSGRITLETTTNTVSLGREFIALNGVVVRCVEPEEWWVPYIEATPGDQSQFLANDGRGFLRNYEDQIPDYNPHMDQEADEQRWVRASNETAETGPAGEHGAPLYIPLDDLSVPDEFPGTSYQNIPLDLTENCIEDGWTCERDLDDTVLCATDIESVSQEEVPEQE